MSEDIFYNCGQEFHRLSLKKWQIIKEKKEYEGVKVDKPALLETLNYEVDFSEKHSEFLCSIRKMKSGDQYIWIPMLFFKSFDQLQRVHLENSFCTNCNWKGIIANPTIPELYFGISDKFELMRKSAELKRATCPVCHGELARFAIWAEK